jgi:TRAP-type mannitol/chloroaromatic compound transport system substrate-binding protein
MKNTSISGKVAGGVIGAAAGVAAIAAGYYFYAKGGKTHRKQASVWIKKAKMEMLKKIKPMKVVSQAAYDKAAAEILEKYKLIKNIEPKELQKFGQELKAHWEEISKEAAKLTSKRQAKKSEAKV